LALYGLPVEKKKEEIQHQRGADLKALSKVIAIEFVVIVALSFLIDSGSRTDFFPVFLLAWLLFFAMFFFIRFESTFLAILYVLADVLFFGSILGLVFVFNPSPVAAGALIIGGVSGALAGFPANLKKVKAKSE